MEAMDLIKHMEAVHAQVQANIEETNRRYKLKVDKHFKQRAEIKEGDLVWIYARKERFPQLRRNKLMPRAIGPFPVLHKIGNRKGQILQNKQEIAPRMGSHQHGLRGIH
jgi:hypothetical protein